MPNIGDVVVYLDNLGKEHNALVAGIRQDAEDHLGKDGQPMLTLVKLVPEAVHLISTGNYPAAMERIVDAVHISSEYAKQHEDKDGGKFSVAAWKLAGEQLAEAAIVEAADLVEEEQSKVVPLKAR